MVKQKRDDLHPLAIEPAKYYFNDLGEVYFIGGDGNMYQSCDNLRGWMRDTPRLEYDLEDFAW